MSAERKGDESTPAPDDAPSPRPFPQSAPASDDHHLEANRVAAVDGANELRRRVPLHARIERTRLELQVAALERALETSRRRRQNVIDQYERVLANRTASDESSPSSGRFETLLDRLRDA